LYSFETAANLLRGRICNPNDSGGRLRSFSEKHEHSKEQIEQRPEGLICLNFF